MLSDVDVESHYNPSVRLTEIEKNGSQCGFHLTRGKWDPYPWVTNVDDGSAAAMAGVKPGDCLLEVNGEDIIGQRISEIAELVKSNAEQVTVLLWNAGVDPHCSPEALCCGPLPKNLQRLSACMTTILTFLECPICLDTISPPTYQCDNGHLICIRCRTKSERCPVCRLRFTRGRSLLSDQIYNSLVDAFDLKEEAVNTRSTKIKQIFKQKKKANVPDIKISQSHTNKFLAKLIGKASSVDNLSTDNKFLSPSDASRSDNDFSSINLKRKSLSTNEIFHSESPSVSRSGSILRLNRREKVEYSSNRLGRLSDLENRPASYHGSFESLERNGGSTLSASLSNLQISTNQEECPLYHCPFSVSCSTSIKGECVFQHFQLDHSDHGPLIQYFGNVVVASFTKIEEDSDLCWVIFFEGATYFLKIYSNRDENDSLTCLKSILIWVWLLGNKISARDYEIQAEIKSSEGDNVFLSVRSSVLSLGFVSSQQVLEHTRGVFLSSKTLQSLGCPSNKLMLHINLLKCDS